MNNLNDSPEIGRPIVFITAPEGLRMISDWRTFGATWANAVRSIQDVFHGVILRGWVYQSDVVKQFEPKGITPAAGRIPKLQTRFEG